MWLVHVVLGVSRVAQVDAGARIFGEEVVDEVRSSPAPKVPGASALELAPVRVVVSVDLEPGSAKTEPGVAVSGVAPGSLRDCAPDGGGNFARIAAGLSELAKAAAHIDHRVRDALVFHRGFHAIEDSADSDVGRKAEQRRPIENTLGAYTALWESGLATGECDVFLSSDGTLLAFHDGTMARFGYDTTPVESLDRPTVEARALVDYGPDASPQCVREYAQVSSLGAILQRCVDIREGRAPGAKDCGMVVELKAGADPAAGVAAGRAVGEFLMRQPELAAAVKVVMSFNYLALEAYRQVVARTLDPKVLLLTIKPEGEGKQAGYPQVAFDESLPWAVNRAHFVKFWAAFQSAAFDEHILDGVYMEATQRTLAWLADGTVPSLGALRAERSLPSGFIVGAWKWVGDQIESLATGVHAQLGAGPGGRGATHAWYQAKGWPAEQVRPTTVPLAAPAGPPGCVGGLAMETPQVDAQLVAGGAQFVNTDLPSDYLAS